MLSLSFGVFEDVMHLCEILLLDLIGQMFMFGTFQVMRFNFGIFDDCVTWIVRVFFNHRGVSPAPLSREYGICKTDETRFLPCQDQILALSGSIFQAKVFLSF